MTVLEKMRDRQIPEYYNTMYRDGFTPYEVLQSAHQTMMEYYNVIPEPMRVVIQVEGLNE